VANVPRSTVVKIAHENGEQYVGSDDYAAPDMMKAEDYKSVVQIIKERLRESGLDSIPKNYLETGVDKGS
jgi:hypothetical protein